MKVLAINGSPRGKYGNTECLLQPFLEGIRETGAETETIYLVEKKIHRCSGCFSCWTKTPGFCIHNDSMPELLEKVRAAHVLVFATPLYVFTVSGLMKDFMDRMVLPLNKPYIVKQGDHYTHPTLHEDDPPKKIVLISNCGFPERHHFSGLVETFRLFYHYELAATILCSCGELLKVPDLQESNQWYTKAVHRAGVEFGKDSRVSRETQAVLDQSLAEPEDYARMANLYWDSVIVGQQVSEHMTTPTSMEALSPALPLPENQNKIPETFLDVITGQAALFNPEAAKSLRADIQFIVSGGESGEYVLRIKDGQCTAHRGLVPSPTLTIHTPSDVWIKIARNELSGQTAFIKGLYRIEGDMEILLRMNRLFSKKEGSKPNKPPFTNDQTTTAGETIERGPIRLPGMAWLSLAFVPWIVHWSTINFPALSNLVQMGIPLLLGVLLWGYRKAYSKPSWMETVSPVFFALSWVFLITGSFSTTYVEVFGLFFLGGVWAATLATSMPLTGEYSKWYWPSALWSHPVFIKTNAIITAVWAGVFMIQATAILAGHFALEHAGLWTSVRLLINIPAIFFTIWFQKWYPTVGSVKTP
ncbi:NAD(P)H-dependent oxidoreductase [Heliobacterium mobile]|uniref:NAD(P)H-dependent oxidoreductase n=1 Tax=Heliobacterium mobile TaxID=28064 RepID=UPI0014780FB8|nr:NAD(P)H-dependent oxidoreductase [Heliobacterium mobile]